MGAFFHPTNNENYYQANRVKLFFSILAFSVFAQAEGVSQDDIVDRILRLNNETFSALSLEPLRGPVHFGIPTDYAQTFLQQFIPRIRDAFPELLPRITCGRSRKLRELATTDR